MSVQDRAGSPTTNEVPRGPILLDAGLTSLARRLISVMDLVPSRGVAVRPGAAQAGTVQVPSRTERPRTDGRRT